MKLEYGSIGYILSIVIAVVLLIITFLLLKRKSDKTKKIVIFFLIMVNFIQHIFKAWVWYPIYHGEIDILNSSLCNICAANIFLSPFIFFSKNKPAKDALFYFGTLGGIGSIITPFYFEGLDIFSWDYLRFYSCHTLVFITSALPIMLGLHTIKFKRFWQLGISFIILELIVFTDNIFIYALENKVSLKESYDIFYNLNPLWVCHPPLDNDALGRIFVKFDMNYFIYNPDKKYIPILYSSYIVYPLITLMAIVFNPLLSLIKGSRKYQEVTCSHLKR